MDDKTWGWNERQRTTNKNGDDGGKLDDEVRKRSREKPEKSWNDSIVMAWNRSVSWGAVKSLDRDRKKWKKFHQGEL